MRSAALFGFVALAWGLTALASPVVAWGLAARGWHFTFARLYDRVFEIVLVAVVAVGWKRLDLGSARELGLRRRGWLRDLARGMAIGIAGVGAALLACWLAGALVPALRFGAAKTVRKAVLGLAAAVAIGIGEEALFRGVLLRRLTRDGGRGLGVALTTALYATVHAMRTTNGSRPLTPWAGLERSATLVAPLLAPTTAPILVGLVGLALVLAWARLRSASLWVPIGIHATWVAVFRVGRLFFVLAPSPAWLVGIGWPPLLGGAAGWLGMALMAGLVWAGLRRTARAG